MDDKTLKILSSTCNYEKNCAKCSFKTSRRCNIIMWSQFCILYITHSLHTIDTLSGFLIYHYTIAIHIIFYVLKTYSIFISGACSPREFKLYLPKWCWQCKKTSVNVKVTQSLFTIKGLSLTLPGMHCMYLLSESSVIYLF